jgi:hypothetical protein
MQPNDTKVRNTQTIGMNTFSKRTAVGLTHNMIVTGHNTQMTMKNAKFSWELGIAGGHVRERGGDGVPSTKRKKKNSVSNVYPAFTRPSPPPPVRRHNAEEEKPCQRPPAVWTERSVRRWDGSISA